MIPISLRRASRCFVVLCMLFPACDSQGPGVHSAELAITASSTSPSRLDHPDGFALDVPAGASDVDMTIVMSTQPASRRAPSQSAIVATPLLLEPEGSTFTKALTLTIPIDPASLPAGRTLDEVVIVTAPHGSTAFVPLPTRRSGNAVVADTMHFSDFVAILWDPSSVDGGVLGTDASIPDAAILDGSTMMLDATMPPDSGTGGNDAGIPDAGADASLPAPNGLKHIFETAVSIGGAFGGAAGGDSICMADANRPNSSSYKALVASSTRRACTTANCQSGPAPLDWVFAPATTYYLGASGAETVFGTTDTNAIVTTYPLVSSFGHGTNFWLGLNLDWTNNSLNCGDWGDPSVSNMGALGSDSATDSSWLGGGSYPCNAGATLVCVEQ